MRKSGVLDGFDDAGQAPPLNAFLRDCFVWNSGKLLILGIVVAAALLAGASWGFRYYATHRAAKFWGPDTVQMIRDAPQVYFVESVTGRSIVHDVSSARGLSHLRNALLENRSYEFDVPVYNTQIAPAAEYQLVFMGPAGSSHITTLCFAADHTWVHEGNSAVTFTGHAAISCRPIAKGLAEMFDEFAEAPPAR